MLRGQSTAIQTILCHRWQCLYHEDIGFICHDLPVTAKYHLNNKFQTLPLPRKENTGLFEQTMSTELMISNNLCKIQGEEGSISEKRKLPTWYSDLAKVG